MKMGRIIFVSLILIIVTVTGCGTVTPVEDPFIEVTSPKEGDVIDGKDGYIEVEWVANNLRVSNVYISFACVRDDKDNKGTQIGDWEVIANVPAVDGHFTFGPDIALWILDTYGEDGEEADKCWIQVIEALEDGSPETEWASGCSGGFRITFE